MRYDRFLLRRVILLAVLTLTLILLHLVPGAPGQHRQTSDRLGWDRPLLGQFAGSLAGIARGDLGTSVRFGNPRPCSPNASPGRWRLSAAPSS